MTRNAMLILAAALAAALYVDDRVPGLGPALTFSS